MNYAFASLVLLCSFLAAPITLAAGMRCYPAPERVILDGDPTEWLGARRKLDEVVKGERGDAGAEVLVAHDDAFLYVAAEVDDDQLVGGGDHLELHLGIPGGTMAVVAMFPGVPGKSKARLTVDRRPVRGSGIVEAPRTGGTAGYTLEAKVPWRALPRSTTTRIGFRATLQLHDVDGQSRRPRAILGTAPETRYASLPPLSMPAEVALGSGLLRERNIQTPPVHNLMANVVGGPWLERVLVYDRFLVVLGPEVRSGKQYFFRDLGADADRGKVPRFELRDLTGDGRDDILLRRRVAGGRGQVDVVEVYSYHAGDESPEKVFAHEVKIRLDGGPEVENRIDVVGRGAGTRITVHADATGRGGNRDGPRFVPTSNTGGAAVLVPWGEIASRTHRVKDGVFVVEREERQPTRGPRPSPVPVSPAPKRRPSPPSDAEKMRRVYALYKRKAGVGGRPRFDLRRNFAGGRDEERLVVHGRDLVIFGPGIREGRAFVATTVSAFAADADLRRVESRDVTGDGRDDIVVKGAVKAEMPTDLGGGELTREVVYVYTVAGDRLERIFGAELGRVVGRKYVRANLAYGRGTLTLTPGRARGYDARTYPWRPKREPEASGFEPLLLPWGDIERVRLAYDGQKFRRRE
ncbi:MAG: hypothetical protein AAF928_18555 [Myxococcota bacterium]